MEQQVHVHRHAWAGAVPAAHADDGQQAELDILEAMAAMEHGGPAVEVEICGGLRNPH